LELKEMQADVDNWVSQFAEGYWSPMAMLASLTEEVGELAREINHLYGEKRKKAGSEENDLALELGDILFVLLCYANSLNIDLEDAFKRVMAKYRERDSHRWTPKEYR
jgi:NTP pyrophosphatase (non-canonical NTP hydrolase)